MKNSSIEWTHHTFNPWIGCTKVKPRQRTSDKYWDQPFDWDREANSSGVHKRVFCASLADVFDSMVPYEWRFDLFELIQATPNLDWLLLTKRPENIRPMIAELAVTICERWDCEGAPPHNVWLGTSVEDQRRANERIPFLLNMPAIVHFLSVEPLLGPVRISDSLNPMMHPLTDVDWVIVGGESGPKARPMDINWVRAIRDECQENSWLFFMKQLGGHPNKRGDISEFPEDLQIREFPNEQNLP